MANAAAQRSQSSESLLLYRLVVTRAALVIQPLSAWLFTATMTSKS